METRFGDRDAAAERQADTRGRAGHAVGHVAPRSKGCEEGQKGAQKLGLLGPEGAIERKPSPCVRQLYNTHRRPVLTARSKQQPAQVCELWAIVFCMPTPTSGHVHKGFEINAPHVPNAPSGYFASGKHTP